MNNEDKFRFVKSISRAIKGMEQDAKCFGYSDNQEFTALIEAMKNYRLKMWTVDKEGGRHHE